MHVHVLYEPEPVHHRLLEGALPGHTLSVGADPRRCDVLVGSRPSEDALRAASPERLVFPFAGIPRATQLLLRERFADLPVHNLHHNAQAAAEGAVALLLAAAKCTLPMDAALRSGDWRPRYAPDPGVLLGGRTALVLGYGAIGRRVARTLAALGMTTLATRLRLAAPERDGDVEVHPAAALADLLPRAQVLMLCLPETDATTGLLGPAELAALPAGAVLVNVARAAIVDEQALYDALRGHLHSAGLDVWYRYPKDEAARASTPPGSLPFHELPNVVLSPHRTGHGEEVEVARYRELAALLLDLDAGVERNRVDLAAGY